MIYIAALMIPVVVVIAFVWVMLHLSEGLAGEVARMQPRNNNE
jgi:hypothetical protein